EPRLRLRELVEIQTFGVLLRHTLAERGEEPELVAADGTTEGGGRIPELLDRADPLRVEVTREQRVVDVARFEARADVGEGGEPREDVAAVARNHVELHAAAVAIGAHAAGLDDHFLDVDLVVDEDAGG